jgi:hypothetical protein
MTELLDHWGYLGIFVAVVLGNVGAPIPETPTPPESTPFQVLP